MNKMLTPKEWHTLQNDPDFWVSGPCWEDKVKSAVVAAGISTERRDMIVWGWRRLCDSGWRASDAYREMFKRAAPYEDVALQLVA